MKKGINKRILALVCALVLAFCDVGSVLAENNVTLPAVEDQEGVELPEQDVIEQPDNGTTETPDDGTTEEPEQPEHIHVYVETITKEPTTTEKGVKTFTCECGDSYTEEIEMLTLNVPVLRWVSCLPEGMKLTWDAMEGIETFVIYRCDTTNSVGEYEELATVDGTSSSFVDENVVSGVIYSYKLLASSGTNKSELSEAKNYIYLEAPVAEASISDEGIYITWNEIPGATGYCVDKVLDDGELDHGAIIGTGWMDTDVENGKTYTYRVYGKYYDEVEYMEYQGAAYEFQVTYAIPDTPSNLKVVNNGYTQLKITWDSVEDVDGYQIYRADSEDGLFKRIVTTDESKYIDKKLTTNQKYYYKVRAYKGELLGDFTEVKSATPKVLTPKMKKTANAAGNYVKVSWTKPAGAHGYYVYRKQGADGTWKQIATVKDSDTTSYKDTTATGKYYYAVKAYKKVDGKTYTSLRANSIQASVLKKAKVSSVKQKGSERAVTVTWEKVNNATGYQVYKKIGKNGSWKLAKTTGKDARSFSSEIPQGTYTYWKVRAIREINDVTVYALFSDSKSFIFATPKFEYSLSTNWGDRETEVTLTIKNTSKGTLRFYSENASLFTEYCDDGERNLYLETSAGKKLTWSEVKAGKTKNFKFKVDGKGVYYYPETIASFMFRYDGLKYLLLTYADSSYYELYLVE